MQTNLPKQYNLSMQKIVNTVYNVEEIEIVKTVQLFKAIGLSTQYTSLMQKRLLTQFNLSEKSD